MKSKKASGFVTFDPHIHHHDDAIKNDEGRSPPPARCRRRARGGWCRALRRSEKGTVLPFVGGGLVGLTMDAGGVASSSAAVRVGAVGAP